MRRQRALPAASTTHLKPIRQHTTRKGGWLWIRRVRLLPRRELRGRGPRAGPSARRFERLHLHVEREARSGKARMGHGVCRKTLHLRDDRRLRLRVVYHSALAPLLDALGEAN